MAAAVLVALLVGITLGGGWWARDRVQRGLARYLDHRLPDASAQVSIASFPFLVHLAASGSVLEVSAHLRQISAGPLSFNGIALGPIIFSDIEIHVRDVTLSRGRLLHGRIVIERIRSATVTATIGQRDLDRAVGLPLTLGKDTVGIGGLTLPATIDVRQRQVTLSVPHDITINVAAPSLAVLPCIGTVVIAPGELRLACTLHQLPPVLAGTSVGF